LRNSLSGQHVPAALNAQIDELIPYLVANRGS
jgi:hypothetical protein